jgi:hypothetical protein
VNSRLMLWIAWRLSLPEGHRDGVRKSAMVLPVLAGQAGKVWSKPSHQPHHFHVAPGFAFQLPAGAHPVEIAIEEELEQINRVVWWASCLLEGGMPEAEFLQIERIDIEADEAHRVFLRDAIVERFGEKGELVSISPLNVVHDGSR